MNLSTASEAQLAEVKNACEEFRAHWQSFRNMPFECQFNGTKEDIAALDYLNYEGLGYPKSYIDGAALVWGNVLATQLGMKWATSYNGQMLLTHDEPGNRITIWPFARVLEAEERSLPQFGRYAWLLGQAIRDLQHFGSLSDQAEAWTVDVLGSWQKTGSPWS